MGQSKIVEGGDLMLFVGDKTLAFSTSHKLSISVETAETTSKDNGGGKWKSATAKKISWNVSSDNLFIEKSTAVELKQLGFGDIFDSLVARTPVEVIFTSATEAEGDSTEAIPATGWTASGTGTYKGKAIITSLEANAANGDNATYSVQLEGVGALVHA